ncbi:hypothetical protein [Lacinutrix sp.]|uniref:hypothetical protein n=1 Tax=Lacinutrix sp. TaxID=1937692 RepID=UPI0025C63B22|nr:hypothetical protein [Lacinutrix sp.]
MKLFKHSLLKITLLLLIICSCTNDDAIVDCNEATIASYLVECPWDVTISNNLLTYTFNNDQTLSIISSDNTFSTTGTWNTSTNNSGQIVVTIVEQFNDFNDEWVFNDCNFADLQVVSTNNPDTIININCSNDTEDCTESIVAGILLECPWDVTVSNNLFTYTFNNDQTLSINLINTTTTGTWSTSTNTSGQIVVTIVEQFNDFNDEWIFNDCDLEALQVVSTNNPDAIININCN